jgi:YD repeat-containing protein
MVQTLTQIDSVNGKEYTSTYNNELRKFTTMSPEGRSTETTTDSLGRVINAAVPGFAPVFYEYDSHGRIHSIREGTGSVARIWTYTYDSKGSLISISNPLNEQTTYTYDDAERIIEQRFADLRQIRFGYDANGNLKTIVAPGNSAHNYDYNNLNLTQAYKPPELDSRATATLYDYNLDRKLSTISRPDGAQIQFNYDMLGRISRMTTPDGNFDYTYDPDNHHLISAITADSNRLFWMYDGTLLTMERSDGVVNDSVMFSYNNNL